MQFNPLRTVRYFGLKFIRLRGNPKSLAMGTAVGVFLGIAPIIPIQTMLVIGVTLLMRVNTITAIIVATIVSNPLTLVPQYYLCWKVGNMLLPGRLSWHRILDVLHILGNNGFMDSIRAVSLLSTDAIIVMLTGGVILGLPLGIISYFFSLYFFRRIALKKRQKHLLD
jgi:uncharacterized protein